MTAMKGHRFATPMLVLVFALCLVSCGKGHDRSLTAAQASARYQPVVNGLAKDLATRFHLTWRTDSPANVQDNGDGCKWYSATLKSNTRLGPSNKWAPVIKVVNERLTKAGFDKVTDANAGKEGWSGFETKDSHNAKVSVMASNWTDLSIEVPVKGSC